MKRIPRKANIIQKKKDKYNRISGGYGYDLGKLVFDKKEPRSKKCGIVDKKY